MSRSQLYYRVFKYSIYFLLACNIVLFFFEDYAASELTFAGGVTLANFVEAFSATVDTFAWVILLLMFELETAVISDEKLRGGLKWVLAGLRTVCYIFIVYSFYGYVTKLGVVTNIEALGLLDVCAMQVADFASVLSLDDYPAVTAETCQRLSAEPIFQVATTAIIGTADDMRLLRNLAWTDVINAGDWLLIVALLEIEVLLQLKGLLSDRLVLVAKFFKSVLYSILFVCAVYWGIDGQFLDFWDAFLWLVAFVFIEMNIFQWQAETRQRPIEAIPAT